MKALAGIALAVALLTISTTARAAQQSSAEQPVLVPISDLLSNPSRYDGHAISTQGKVDGVYSATVFTIESDRLFDTGRDAIVVMPEADAVVLQNAEVSVVGVVHPFERTMTRRFGLTNIAESVLRGWDSRPVIFARSVRTAHGIELVAPLRNGDDLWVASSERGERATHSPLTTIPQIVNSIDKLAIVETPVVLTDVPVQRVAGVRSFWIGDNHMRVFVVVEGTSLAAAIGDDRGLEQADRVSLEGKIERVPGTLGQVKVTSWGKLDDRDAEALSDRDVYIYATHVERVAQP